MWDVSLSPDPNWPHRSVKAVLHIRTAPKYLRFVVRGINWDSLDALDQPGDEPEDEERVIPAVLQSTARGFMCGRTKGGKPTGAAFWQADYIGLGIKLPDRITRDEKSWNEWVSKQPPTPER